MCKHCKADMLMLTTFFCIFVIFFKSLDIKQKRVAFFMKMLFNFICGTYVCPLHFIALKRNGAKWHKTQPHSLLIAEYSAERGEKW